MHEIKKNKHRDSPWRMTYFSMSGIRGCVYCFEFELCILLRVTPFTLSMFDFVI